ncbi:ATP-binding protein [Shewanella corallii]|uniref:ATP-binding protein n=1 Tax=Shewanella corallii TaxID=560080 RepID=A0ABT0NC91_9GAMM|nr:ATP-binding protein [Shewanella corallii]
MNSAYLEANNWDDFGFKSRFYLVVYDANGEKHEIGGVKIGYVGQESGWTEERLPKEFQTLDKAFFSLGQSDEYYQNLYALDQELRDLILESLNDVVYEEGIYNLALNEKVMKVSLLREVSIASIKGQFRRLLDGGKLRTEFNFSYSLPQGKHTAGLDLEFYVDPESNPPSNIHVLIGRNGVGKTHLLHRMVKALVDSGTTQENDGSFSVVTGSKESTKREDLLEMFAGVVSVAFSAFDPFEPIPERQDKSEGLNYAYIGLKQESTTEDGEHIPMSRPMLNRQFSYCLNNIRRFGYQDRLVEAIRGLETDSLFKDIALADIVMSSTHDLETNTNKIFSKLSSGHAIVLLTIAKLVEKIEEKTLVLLDEPESHLHPPLLSAFIRTLSELLSHRNAVAVIATHSPVILQEVPKSCVWKLRRSGMDAVAERLETETFGENVGVLTREVFGLEVTDSGFHQLLKKESESARTYNQALRNFHGQLGAEARGILRGLFLDKEEEKGEV